MAADPVRNERCCLSAAKGDYRLSDTDLAVGSEASAAGERLALRSGFWVPPPATSSPCG